eukprot:689167-Prymnesium_polylepis.1
MLEKQVEVVVELPPPRAQAAGEAARRCEKIVSQNAVSAREPGRRTHLADVGWTRSEGRRTPSA